MKKGKILKHIFLVTVLVFGMFAGIGGVSAPNEPEYSSGEVIVGLKEINAAAKEAIEAKGGTVIKEISALNALVVKVPAMAEKAFTENVRSVPGYRYAERNGVVKAVGTFGDSLQPQYTPSDPDWYLQWNMVIIEAEAAWDIEMGSTGVVIAILDTGIDYNHQDLSAHYVAGGYDWVNMDPDPWDDHYHGTHCAGIAAAEMNNGFGVTGVTQSSLWAEKVLDSGGSGWWDDLADGIVHATNAGVDVISMSLGGTGYSVLVEDACAYAYSMGVLLVGAAGNSNMDIGVTPFYPACYETVMAISGTDYLDNRYTSSNYGYPIEVAAPGVDVYSTMPGNSYGYLTGTSMSTPHVAGVAALTWSLHPSLTNVEMRGRLWEAVDDLGDPGWDPYFGYGRTNALKALTGGMVYDYHFRMSPYINEVHFNMDPDGWVYGYMTGGVTDWNPVLGRIIGRTLVAGVDVLPDEYGGGQYETLFFYASASINGGELIQTYDGLMYYGPSSFTIVPVAAGSDDAEGQDLTTIAGSETTPAAWYKLGFNEFSDIINIEVHMPGSPWVNGYDEIYTPDAPMLGIIGGGHWFYCIDFLSSYYNLAFTDNTIASSDGWMIRTIDGTSFVGPTYVSYYPLK
jgi:hypothetical protein